MSTWASPLLGDVATFVRGINFKPPDIVDLGTSDSVACMRTKNVQEKLDLSDVWAVPKKFVKRNDQILHHGDVLVSSANSWNLVGKCCWIPELPWSASFGGFVSVLRANSEKVEPRYLYRWFSSDRVQNIVRSFGRQTTNISNLDINRCLEMTFPLPPIAQQKRIAAILDRAEELRGLRRQALAALDAIVQSIFLEMFGDLRSLVDKQNIVSLSSICHSINDGTHKTPVYVSCGIPFITVKNIVSGKLDFSNTKFISEEEHKELTKRTKPERGDVLVSKDGTIGVPCPIQTNAEFSSFVSVALLKPKADLVDQIFLVAQLSSEWLQEQIRAGTKGIAIRHLHLTDFKRLKLLLPPLSLQQEFVQRVEAIEQLKATHRESLAQLDALFASLQHRAFRGELSP